MSIFLLDLPQKKHLNIESFQISGDEKLMAKEVAIFREVDEASIFLFKAALSGEVFSEAVISMQKSKDSTEGKIAFKLKMPFIGDYEIRKGLESFTMKFVTLVVTNAK